MRGARVLAVLISVSVAALIALAAIGQTLGPDSATDAGPPATVDDVYAALTTALGATPDFESQVKPVLQLHLSYKGLQDFVKNGGLESLATAAPASVTAAPLAPSGAPIATNSVTMTQVLKVVQAEWGQQPQPICTPGGPTCQPAPDFTRVRSMACDHTGTVSVPAAVSCTFVDSALGPQTLSLKIDANNVVIWRGCSPPGAHEFGRDCVQAAPTAMPLGAPGPISPLPASNCGGFGSVTVSITDGRPHPVQILIDGVLRGYDIVNAFRVGVGSHTVLYVYADGSRVASSRFVGDCQNWLIRSS